MPRALRSSVLVYVSRSRDLGQMRPATGNFPFLVTYPRLLLRCWSRDPNRSVVSSRPARRCHGLRVHFELHSQSAHRCRAAAVRVYPLICRTMKLRPSEFHVLPPNEHRELRSFLHCFRRSYEPGCDSAPHHALPLVHLGGQRSRCLSALALIALLNIIEKTHSTPALWPPSCLQREDDGMVRPCQLDP